MPRQKETVDVADIGAHCRQTREWPVLRLRSHGAGFLYDMFFIHPAEAFELMDQHNIQLVEIDGHMTTREGLGL